MFICSSACHGHPSTSIKLLVCLLVLLQGLDLRPGSVPSGFIEAGSPHSPHVCVYPDEQAAIYCGWAEAALRRVRGCSCAGCAALAMNAVAAGQKQVASLLAFPELAAEQQQERVARVGAAMARLVHCKAALLLQTDVRQSATRAGIWRAQQCLQVWLYGVCCYNGCAAADADWMPECLQRTAVSSHPADAPCPPARPFPQEWERLRQLGMTSGLGEDDILDLQCLDAWCRSAASDLLLLEALQGAPLLPLQPLAEVLPQAVTFDAATGKQQLGRAWAASAATQLLMMRLAAALTCTCAHVC